MPSWEDTEDDGAWGHVGGYPPHAGPFPRMQQEAYRAKLRLLLLFLERGASGGKLPFDVVETLDLHQMMNTEFEFPLGLLLINAIGKEAARKLEILDHVLRVHVEPWQQVDVDDYYKETMGRVYGRIKGQYYA